MFGAGGGIRRFYFEFFIHLTRKLAERLLRVLSKRTSVSYTHLIAILPLSDGTITVTGTVNGQSGQDVTNNGYVDYGTDIAVTVIPESSHVVTKICDTEVNDCLLYTSWRLCQRQNRTWPRRGI